MSFDQEHDERLEEMLRTMTTARCTFIVGAALASKYPTDHDWEQALNSSVVLEALLALIQVWSDIESTSNEEYLSPDAVLEISEQHYDRAIEALSELADHAQVSPDDLLMILING